MQRINGMKYTGQLACNYCGLECISACDLEMVNNNTTNKRNLTLQNNTSGMLLENETFFDEAATD